MSNHKVLHANIKIMRNNKKNGKMTRTTTRKEKGKGMKGERRNWRRGGGWDGGSS